MRTVRVKIHNGEFVNLTFDPITCTWKSLLQVPSETSYSQQDHKYGMIFEAWDEYNNNVILDRTDTEFGADLVVRVREEQTPVIQFTGPVRVEESLLHVAFDVTDEGGSNIDLDSIKIQFGQTIFDRNDPGMVITEVTPGTYYKVAFDPLMNVQDGVYEITAEARDGDENIFIASFYYEVDTDPTEFITDRTQADVDLVKELREKYLNGTITEEEKELYATNLKGARNRSDFIRILTNMRYIATMFEIPYSMDELPEIPRESYIQQLRDNVEMFRQKLPIHDTTPYTPFLPINSWQKMNDLEQILYDVHENLKYRFNYYCGNDAYTGLYMYEDNESAEGYIPDDEVIGTIE